MLKLCSVYEYFQKVPADLRHYIFADPFDPRTQGSKIIGLERLWNLKSIICGLINFYGFEFSHGIDLLIRDLHNGGPICAFYPLWMISHDWEVEMAYATDTSCQYIPLEGKRLIQSRITLGVYNLSRDTKQKYSC